MMHTGIRVVGVLGFAMCWAAPLVSQSNLLKLSPQYDNVSAPSAAPLPGLNGGFRQQILISASRLVGLQSRSLNGLQFRRDLDYAGAQRGGEMDLLVRVSSAQVAPDKAEELFAQNSGFASIVFQGRVVVPDSPVVGTAPVPWSAINSVVIPFSTAYPYTGGNLCVDIEGRPLTGNEPEFWYVDHELGGSGGIVTPIGKSCSSFRDASDQSLYADSMSLQIGSSMRLTGLGRPGASPLMLFGASAIPGGIDLSLIGAAGCSQYVNYFLTLGLSYRPPQQYLGGSFTHFETQIPPQKILLGAKVYVQFADLETSLPRSSWTNPIGLTTTNGLELRIALAGPSVGMSTVTSHVVGASDPMPLRGQVDVEAAPVMRVMVR